MKKYFNTLIKKALKNKNISLRELARKTRLDVSFLSKILNGKRNPPSEEKDIIKIAKILEINPTRLLFSAGRIPTEYQEFFIDEKFINKLLKEKKSKNKAKITINRKTSKKTGQFKIKTIEDELL